MHIVSAFSLDNVEVETIKKQFNHSGEVELDIDKSLIGGIRVRFGNNLYDGSVRHQLDKLRDKIYKTF